MATLTAALAGIAFLVGSWNGGSGTVADTHGTSRGTSAITSEVNGAVLLRKDHTDTFTASGAADSSFDQIMMIYPDGGAVHADYSDGTHVIHYTSAQIVPGTSVTFATAIAANAPAYRLTYERIAPDKLAVRFEVEPPGQSAFLPIASGTLQRKM